MSDIPTSVLGRTGETVTKLAYGAMELRGAVPGMRRARGRPERAKTILNAVLDAGITMIDTSPDYGGSEGSSASSSRTDASSTSWPRSAAARSTRRPASGRRTSSRERTSAPGSSRACGA